ncbi:hypothetical protein NBRC3280_2504 [Acetobacter pasteurianus NBRC 3280]|uniref:Uncharacterized protein n=1 Tax=Acetobacter pasteurianus NBRC 3278 TaxID=1226660 RepID=A0A401X5A6_ACEPA|nr:hypothetical protein NBRC3277_2484 [Acetobacter pasteurianus NBRC 3277]GCD63125.1 hypothetical protein NBRC3278_2218 [Acetobacter pasteurianus NBRC 3278]GCD69869.1 hypothetical protein NBRC3280_2504 [Acetobacter pasteurianus NBRC 3280]
MPPVQPGTTLLPCRKPSDLSVSENGLTQVRAYNRWYELVVAGYDGTELFEFIEEPLNKITFPVKSKVCFPSYRSIAFGRYDRDNPALCQPINQSVGIIRFVSKESVQVDVVQKRFSASDISILTLCDIEFHRVAQGIANGMYLCGQAAPGSSDGLIRTPFLRAPALCWCARTIVLSIIMYSLS